FGVNENGVPHALQKPSLRPAAPSRDRPTGAPQRGLLQNRLFSATLGSAMTAVAGSRYGIGAISTSPAPRRLRALVRVRAVWERRSVVIDVTAGLLAPPVRVATPADCEPGRGAMPQTLQ